MQAIKLKTSGLDMQWVVGNFTESLRKNIVAFWMHEGALVNRNGAWRRSWKVATVFSELESGTFPGYVGDYLFRRRRPFGFNRLSNPPA